jgi:DNA-binding response OmpR family regulator
MSLGNIAHEFSALIIDDNWFNRDIFRIALQSAGYDVIAIDSGSEGLEVLRRKTFNLLVLDLQCDVSGKTALSAVRSHAMHDDMAVIVVTDNASLATGEIDNLADHVVYKPINIKDFADFARQFQACPASAFR